MENENYINIQGWMINDLNLKGNELLLYAIIYGFSQNGEGEYYGSQRYISKALKISLPTANKLINSLLKKGLIIKKEESHYQAVFKREETEVLKKVKQGVKETLTVGVKETLTNKYNTNNIINNNNITCEDKPRNDVQELLRLFYENLNPNIKFQNKTLRADAEFLVNHYPLDKLEMMILYIKEHQGEQYFPTITTPTQLRDKMALIINHRNREIKGSKIIKI